MKEIKLIKKIKKRILREKGAISGDCVRGAKMGTIKRKKCAAWIYLLRCC